MLTWQTISLALTEGISLGDEGTDGASFLAAAGVETNLLENYVRRVRWPHRLPALYAG